MLQMDWSDIWRRAFRIELRAEAAGFAAHGWPVLPGTYPTGSGWAGREEPSLVGPLPVHSDWQKRIGTDAERDATAWADQPYTLLVATGVVLDAIEVDDALGRSAARVLRSFGMPAPIIATPDGRWVFLTATGRELRGELVENEQVTLHAQGSWVPLPPSPYEHGVVHWRVKPEVCGWRLPDSYLVQEALVDALSDGDNHSRLRVAQLLMAD
jgi:hypothetical protein